MVMTEAAKEARRQYKRAWRAKNKDRAEEYQRRYWERKAAEQKTQEQPAEDRPGP